MPGITDRPGICVARIDISSGDIQLEDTGEANLDTGAGPVSVNRVAGDAADEFLDQRDALRVADHVFYTGRGEQSPVAVVEMLRPIVGGQIRAKTRDPGGCLAHRPGASGNGPA